MGFLVFLLGVIERGVAGQDLARLRLGDNNNNILTCRPRDEIVEGDSGDSDNSTDCVSIEGEVTMMIVRVVTVMIALISRMTGQG